MDALCAGFLPAHSCAIGWASHNQPRMIRAQELAMADKIPHDVLLPFAMELYKKVPSEVTAPVVSKEDRIAALEKSADDFANFYNRLYDRLVNPQR